jgi:hypothetical protein
VYRICLLACNEYFNQYGTLNYRTQKTITEVVKVLNCKEKTFTSTRIIRYPKGELISSSRSTASIYFPTTSDQYMISINVVMFRAHDVI